VTGLASREDRAIVAEELKRANVSSRSRVNAVALAARNVVALDAVPAEPGSRIDLEHERLVGALFDLLSPLGASWLASDILLRLRLRGPVQPQRTAETRKAYALAIALLAFVLLVFGAAVYGLVTEKPGDHGDGSVRPGTPHSGALP
jgi:hypothetical protein